METRLTLPFPVEGRLSVPVQTVREIAGWLAAPESRQVNPGGAMAGVMASRKHVKPTSAVKEAAVSARLRAMVEDVERWPVPEALLQVIENLEELAGQDELRTQPKP